MTDVAARRDAPPDVGSGNVEQRGGRGVDEAVIRFAKLLRGSSGPRPPFSQKLPGQPRAGRSQAVARPARDHEMSKLKDRASDASR